ncbi:MAG: CsoS2 family carboxysome shell protein [Thiogranum sp.]|nr:CsoS2 family carboxysome shell protein [Thiogranum sp.]
MASLGKIAIGGNNGTHSAASQAAGVKAAAEAAQEQSGCGCGCKSESRESGQREDNRAGAVMRAPKVNPKRRAKLAPQLSGNSSRATARARRLAMSSRGKGAMNGNGVTAAGSARIAHPHLSSRDLAQVLRAQRSQKGAGGSKKAAPTGRMRPARPAAGGGAVDAHWKVGASETAHGQVVTGTMVGRSRKTTGDEPSTCRTVTGTEYMGADIFRDFCQSEPVGAPPKVQTSATGRGNNTTGSQVGRSRKVTGDEPGTCQRVTGIQHVGAEQSATFCGVSPESAAEKVTHSGTRKGKVVTGSSVGRSSKVTGDEPGAMRELTGTQYTQAGAQGKHPAKVGISQTLRGGAVTGTLVGRASRVTGDEPGSCRNITGDDYVGREQYAGFCDSSPTPQDRKVGLSQTFKGKPVSGTLTGRSERVTGDEPGTCKSITGTPYAGAEQYRDYCEPQETTLASLRTPRRRSTPGAMLSGQQPGLDGNITGAGKGACEPVSGTPYVGADQFAAACPSTPAEAASPDFPVPLDGTPWGQFSVSSPGHAVQAGERHGVTGTRYEQGHITGPFGMAGGKVTGTEEFRFGSDSMRHTAVLSGGESVQGRIKSRITGEGMDAGLKITGDDWDRGDSVTGTEGSSARRNPTRQGGGQSVRMQRELKRNEAIAEPVSRVTGSSGNTEKGAMVTYSGGARG